MVFDSLILHFLANDGKTVGVVYCNTAKTTLLFKFLFFTSFCKTTRQENREICQLTASLCVHCLFESMLFESLVNLENLIYSRLHFIDIYDDDRFLSQIFLLLSK